MALQRGVQVIGKPPHQTGAERLHAVGEDRVGFGCQRRAARSDRQQALLAHALRHVRAPAQEAIGHVGVAVDPQGLLRMHEALARREVDVS